MPYPPSKVSDKRKKQVFFAASLIELNLVSTWAALQTNSGELKANLFLVLTENWDI